MPLTGATLSTGDPATPFCSAPATVWRRVQVPRAGAYRVTAEGQAATLTAFADPLSGDSALACADGGDGEPLAVVFRAERAGGYWLRVGADRPDDATAAARLRIAATDEPVDGPGGRAVGGPGTGAAPGTGGSSAGAADELLRCLRTPVLVTDLRPSGRRAVRIGGVAGRGRSGERVRILRVGSSATVARATVGADGRFSRTFRVPARGRAAKVRYVAAVGGSRSAAVHLHRRFSSTSVRPSWSRVTVKARVSRPLGRDARVRIAVGHCRSGRVQWRTERTVRRSRSGAVNASIVAPDAGSALLVRLSATVRSAGPRGRDARTYTLPQILER